MVLDADFISSLFFIRGVVENFENHMEEINEPESITHR